MKENYLVFKTILNLCLLNENCSHTSNHTLDMKFFGSNIVSFLTKFQIEYSFYKKKVSRDPKPGTFYGKSKPVHCRPNLEIWYPNFPSILSKQ